MVDRLPHLGLGLVPNAPCGVESNEGYFIHVFYELFLMHRVELKAFKGFSLLGLG